MIKQGVVKKVCGDVGRVRLVKDADGDGVINVLDCKPYDKNQQGFFHNVKERVKEYSEAREERLVAEADIRKKERAAYYAAKERESLKYAEERARIEREQKVKRLKERKPMSFGSFMSPLVGSGSSRAAPVSGVRRKKVTYVKMKGGKGYKKKVTYVKGKARGKEKKKQSGGGGFGHPVSGKILGDLL